MNHLALATRVSALLAIVAFSASAWAEEGKKELKIKQPTQLNFTEADTNKDQALTLAELTAYYAIDIKAQAKEQLKDATEETLNKLAEEVAKKFAEPILAKLDTNKDGKVTIEEIKAAQAPAK